MKKEKSISSDKIVLILMEVFLLSILLLSVIKDVILYFHNLSSSASAIGGRGEQSMNTLYTIYGITTVFYTLAIQLAKAFKGNKVLLFILNYFALTYLFFFNVWFRNSIFFPLLLIISKSKLL
jgi:hypothetical protein